MLWSLVAGCADVGLGLFGDRLPVPAVDLLAAVGSALALPAVALLHARNHGHRASGAVLATALGAAAAVVGLAAAVGIERLAPAWFVLLGMWWWTLGKMTVQTGTLPRAFGVVTASAAVAAFAATLLADPQGPLGASAAAAVVAAGRCAFGTWLLALGAVLAWGGRGAGGLARAEVA